MTGVVALPRRVFRNAAALFVSGALTRVLRIIVFLALARHLGLAPYGLLAFVVAYVEVFRVVADFGVDTVLIRHLTSSPTPGTLLGSAAVLKVLLVAIAYGIGAGVAHVAGYGPERFLLLLVGLAGIVFSSSSNLFASLFQSRLEARRIAWTGVAGTIVYLLLATWGIASGRGVAFFVGAGVAAELCSAVLALALFTRQVRWGWGGWEVAWRLARDAAPIGVMTVLVILYARLGLLALDRTHGAGAVGTYAVAVRLVEFLPLLAGAVSGSVYVAMAQLFAEKRVVAAQEHFGVIYRHVVVAAATGALTLILAGRTLLGAIRPEFVAAWATLSIMASAAVCMFANQLTAAILLAEGRGPSIMKVAAWNLGVNATLVVLLVPRFGAVGAALALLGTEGLNTLIQSYLVRAWLRLVFLNSLWLRIAGALAGAAWLTFYQLPHLGWLIVSVFLALAVWRHDVSAAWVRHAIGIAGE